MSDPGGPWASLRWPREEAGKQAGRAPGFAAALRPAELCRSAAGRGAQTRQLLGLARPRSLARVGAERGPASPGEDAAQQHPTAPPPRARRHARQALAKRSLAHASPAPGAAGPRSPFARRNRAARWGARAGGRWARHPPGARGSRLRSTPRRSWSAPGQGSCPTLCCLPLESGGRPPSRTRAPLRSAKLQRGWWLPRLGLPAPHPEGARPAKGAASTSPARSGANWVRSGQRGQRSRGPARSPAPTPPLPSALTVAEAQRNQHDGQHDDDLGIHGTGGRLADSGGTRSERGGGE